MKNQNQKPIAPIFLWLLGVMLTIGLWTTNANAQITVTNPGNTTPVMSATYTSLALAIADVNNNTAGITALPAGSSYLWTPGNQTTNYIQNQAPGSYAVKVTAPGGCYKLKSIIVN